MADVSAADALARATEAIGVGDSDTAVASLSAAIRAFTAEQQWCGAAMACLRLGDVFANFLGNQTAARAWFLRAERLVADQPDCVEQGWVAVAAMGCDVDDPADLLRRAELALERARQFGDVNLETKALADGGLAHVQAGRLAEGMELLDEAMALACAAADDLDAAGKSVCSFFTACQYAPDFERAQSWTDSLRQRGLIGNTGATQLFLSGHCDSVQARMLIELGRWGEAESLLTKANAAIEDALQIPSWHPAIVLADLRVRQGRLTEAEALLVGKEGHVEALLPAARLQLRRGDLDLVIALARRGLRLVGDDRLRAPDLIALLVEAHVRRGELAEARAACDDLARRALPERPLVQARLAAVRARVEEAGGDIDAAVRSLQAAVDALAGMSAPVLRLELLLRLAELHEARGASVEAALDAREAAALVRQLDVALDQDQQALLGRLRAHAETPNGVAPVAPAVLTFARGGVHVEHAGVVARLSVTKGLQYLAELVAHPGAERHALDLVDRVEGVGAVDRRSIGDAGPLLDATARATYRHRIAALRTEVDDLLAVGNEDEAMRRQQELDRYVAELASAFGLSGRERHPGSASEKARVNVTRAIRGAIGRLTEVVPAAGAALDRGVRTGLYCAYEPREGDVRWIVQSGVNTPASV